MHPERIFAGLAILFLVSPGPHAAELDGHIKTRASGEFFPDDSVSHAVTGSSAGSLAADFRLNFAADKGPWSFDASWQGFVAFGDALELGAALSAGGGQFQLSGDPDDRRRFDLTDVLEDDDRQRSLHRLDRLSIGYTGERFVMRVGRQALSWGNGLFFSPMDIVNPFDPRTVDTEYKAGDDMVTAQWLRSNGDDLQFAYVFRRDPLTGASGSEVATAAIKYHGIVETAEYDIMLADHYGRATIGIGGTVDIAGAVLRGDTVYSSSAFGSDALQLAVNLSYSWVWSGRNVSGVVEYYHANYGQRDGSYGLFDIAANPELAGRLARGDAFTIGRNYLAAGLTVEMSPLWLLTPNLYGNVGDGSALLQLVSQTSLSDESVLLAAVNLPVGPKGSEFGGIPAPIGGTYFATDLSLFVQFAWYF